MKLCTTCGRRWDIVGTRCPEDGTPLVVADAARAGRASPSATWSTEQPALAQLRPAARDELAPGDCVGEYVIERRIGAGGMGVVYGARHPVIGKRAAIKILGAKRTADDEAVSRFVLEAQAVNRIGHANIVDIFSFGTLDDGRSYFAMEWLQGETLGQRLARGRLTVREAIAILSPLCRALEAAHAAGVIHRDLKPDNVFLATDDDGWRVKLLDFGIAKLSTATAQVSRTATGVAMGTPLYMAPEQARGEAVDGRTDVYALGLLAYTMVCGVSLFEDEGSAIEILAAHISLPPVPPRERAPDLPAAFDALVLEMIAKQPDQRPALSEIRRRLAAIAATADRPAPPVIAGAPTLPVSIAGLPSSRPPEMPGPPASAAAPASHSPTMPGADPPPPSRPPTMPGAPSAADAPHSDRQSPIPSADDPDAERRSPMPSADDPHALAMRDAPLVAGGPAWRPSTASGSVPTADDPHGSTTVITSRRPWWPLGLAALVAVAVAGVVISLRGSSAPPAAGPPAARATQTPGAAAQPAVPGALEVRPAQPPSSAPSAAPAVAARTMSAAAAAAPPAPAAADSASPPPPATADSPAPPTAAPPVPAQVTAELAVEPAGARLVVDGQPVTLVAGRATLALPPGDHEALASAAGRVTRQRFHVTAGRAVRVALRVPEAPAAAAPAPPRTASHAGDDVDGVEDPFRK